jgi:hypothetical protein
VSAQLQPFICPNNLDTQPDAAEATGWTMSAVADGEAKLPSMTEAIFDRSTRRRGALWKKTSCRPQRRQHRLSFLEDKQFSGYVYGDQSRRLKEEGNLGGGVRVLKGCMALAGKNERGPTGMEQVIAAAIKSHHQITFCINNSAP